MSENEPMRVEWRRCDQTGDRQTGDAPRLVVVCRDIPHALRCAADIIDAGAAQWGASGGVDVFGLSVRDTRRETLVVLDPPAVCDVEYARGEWSRIRVDVCRALGL